MLQEILLSLSGHPSPILQTPTSQSSAAIHDVLTPPERDLLAPLARLADLNTRLQAHTSHMSSAHGSPVCRAVAAAALAGPLAEFQQHILKVERLILERDSSLVGDANTVPLTALVGEFTGWTRRLEWLWDVVVAGYMLGNTRHQREGGDACTGAGLIDCLRREMVSGYADIEIAARSLTAVAETAWLKQVSAWILYGRLPTVGAGDFFIQAAQGDDDDDGEFIKNSSLLPSFVTQEAASSMLFIGKSLAHIRLHRLLSASAVGLPTSAHITEQLCILSQLEFPLDSAAFSRAVSAVRLSLSRNTLQKLLPLSKVVEALRLLRRFLLMERGEFAVALVQEADDKMRSRWKGRSDTPAAAAGLSRRREGLSAVVMKAGEVTAVLGKTWAVMEAMQGRHAEEDEGLEMARLLLRLELQKSNLQTPLTIQPSPACPPVTIAPTPFRNLLLAVPVSLTLDIPSPLDMFLSPSDLAAYSDISAYLLSIRRAHIHLTNLWKITPLRRHHPAPPGPPQGSTRSERSRVVLLRQRDAERAACMKGPWVTCSAAVFFLAETEAYLQGDVVSGMWEGFLAWLTGKPKEGGSQTRRPHDEDLLEAQVDAPFSAHGPPHDPQTLTMAHHTYLAALSHHLGLASPSFTDPLYALLTRIDHLVALVHRLHAIWNAADLETDAAVVDAFVDLECEERDIRQDLGDVQVKVRGGVQEVVVALRMLVAGGAIPAYGDMGVEDMGVEDGDSVGPGLGDRGANFAPPRIGGLERLLMKLDFGVWFGDKGAYDQDEFQ